MDAGSDRSGVRSDKQQVLSLIDPELGRLNIDAGPDRSRVR